MKERKTAVRIQFDNDSESYNLRYLTSEKLREKNRIMGLIGRPEKYDRILDLGCGPGIITESLLDISDKVYGIDLSEDMIENAVKRFNDKEISSRLFFSVGDAEKLDFPDYYFDVVVCLGVLRYLDSLEKGLKEIHRVLRPGGALVGTFYSRYSLYWSSIILLYRPLLPIISLLKRQSFRNMMLKYKAEPAPFSYKKFRRVLNETGFQHSETLHSGIDLFPVNRLFPGLSRSVSLKTEEVLHRSSALGWIGSICIVKGIKK